MNNFGNSPYSITTEKKSNQNQPISIIQAKVDMEVLRQLLLFSNALLRRRDLGFIWTSLVLQWLRQQVLLNVLAVLALEFQLCKRF